METEISFDRPCLQDFIATPYQLHQLIHTDPEMPGIDQQSVGAGRERLEFFPL
jgi:hypothetical protein